MKNTVKVSVILILAIGALALGKNATSAQNAGTPSLVGTWNFQGTVNTSPPLPYIFVMSFNAGGTTMEFDSTATGNPSTGESISLGTWKRTGASTYSFKEENYTYDTSGNLADIAIATANMTLSSDGQSVMGTGSVSFYTCSVTVCPGALVSGPSAESITGSRI